MTSGLEIEWDYFGRIKGRDGPKKKTGKANEKRKRGKVKRRTKDEEVNGQGKKEVPRAHVGWLHDRTNG